LAITGWATAAAAAGRPAAYDVITMKNGDIHQGTIAVQIYRLTTPYGRVSLPFGELARLEAAADGMRIVTHAGERLHGRIEPEDLPVLRALHARLMVHVREIERIDFGNYPRSIPGPETFDVIGMRNGDILHGRLQNITPDLVIDGMTESPAWERIDMLDLEEGEDTGTWRVQVQVDGEAVSRTGRLTLEDLALETVYGQQLTVPAAMVEVLHLRQAEAPGAAAASVPLLRSRPPATVFQDSLVGGGAGPLMVPLQGGEFQRGDDRDDADNDERPARTIRLAPFAIAVHEVTFEEYDRYCHEARKRCPDDSGWGRGSRPVINVSWEEVNDYTAWLSRKTGQRYRLPSDAEWEYAARGGSQSRFWWGDGMQAGRANCATCGSLWDSEKTARAGRFAANPFGLFDTAGNVFEWAADCWSDSYADAPADGSPLETVGCGKRVIRGGAWSFPEHEIRSANRWRDFPSRRSDDTGFRVARDL